MMFSGFINCQAAYTSFEKVQLENVPSLLGFGVQEGRETAARQDFEMAELQARTTSVTQRVIQDLREILPGGQANPTLEENWPLVESVLEKYVDTLPFDQFIDFLIDVTQFYPQMRLSMRLVSHLYNNFKLNLQHPLRAVYVLINHVAGPIFLQIMNATKLPLLMRETSDWSFLDESKDLTGVSHWLNVHVCAALNSPVHVYALPQSWLDIALFNACRRQNFLSFRIQTSGPVLDVSKLDVVLKRLYQRLTHTFSNEIKEEFYQMHDTASCREVLSGAPYFFYRQGLYFPNCIMQKLIEIAQKNDCSSQIWVCLAELAKLDQLPPPTIKTPFNHNYFNVLLTDLKPQPLAARRAIFYALLTLVEKKYSNQFTRDIPNEQSLNQSHMSRLSPAARRSLCDFFREPVSGKLYRFNSEDTSSLLHFFEIMRQRKGIVFSCVEVDKYAEIVQKNLASDFIN